jgi:FAD/FMN-containing dehydrogenase
VLPSWLGGGDYGVDRTRTGFSAEHYERLVALKDQYDPTNLFRLNHNIPPSTKK